MQNVRVDPRAQQELVDAALWYNDRGEWLPKQLLDEVSGVVRDIERWPTAHPRLNLPEVDRTLRRARLKKFPYCLVYLTSDTEIVVIALVRQSRWPLYWADRLNDV